jgi:hypothetical protein
MAIGQVESDAEPSCNAKALLELGARLLEFALLHERHCFLEEGRGFGGRRRGGRRVGGDFGAGHHDPCERDDYDTKPPLQHD